jgi:hypothetical protein
MTARTTAHWWRRRLPLACGCFDPCRCDDRVTLTGKRVDAYLDAVTWLAQHNLGAAALVPECRELWRRGGADRLLAESLVGRWSA